MQDFTVYRNNSTSPPQDSNKMSALGGIASIICSSLLEQKQALGVYAADFELPAPYTSYQWEFIENIENITLQEPLEELTKLLINCICGCCALF